VVFMTERTPQRDGLEVDGRQETGKARKKRSLDLVKKALTELAKEGRTPTDDNLAEATRRVDLRGRGVERTTFTRNLEVREEIARARGRKLARPLNFEGLFTRNLRPGRDLTRVYYRYRTKFSREELARRLIAAEEDLINLRDRQAQGDQAKLAAFIASLPLDPQNT
jgi:hypothetical protein